MNENYYLGIDIGTTSTKIILVSVPSNEPYYSKSVLNEAYIEVDNSKHKEQNVEKILQSINDCLNSMKDEVGQKIMSSIKSIGVCGQMHGCVFWNVSENAGKMFCDSYSNLITWQDQRCSAEFIKTLPKHDNSSIPLSTGFGCATIFWLQKHKPDFIKQYRFAGTIMDFLVFNLCGNKTSVMSTQNALSWGCFSLKKAEWNIAMLKEANFPLNLLPEIKQPKSKAGCLKQDWFGIPKGVKILTALGDMQCSVFSCQPTKNEAVFNLSTSAQLSIIVPKHIEVSETVTVVPYFDSFLVTAASLNGGMVFADFVKMLFDWTKQFAPKLTMQEIYDNLADVNAEQNDLKDNKGLIISPTVYGERHAPDAYGSVSNIQIQHLNIKLIAKTLAESIIKNTADMFNKGLPHNQKINRVWACGSPFLKNHYFRDAMTKCFGESEIRFDRSLDAAYGVALVASEGVN